MTVKLLRTSTRVKMWQIEGPEMLTVTYTHIRHRSEKHSDRPMPMRSHAERKALCLDPSPRNDASGSCASTTRALSEAQHERPQLCGHSNRECRTDKSMTSHTWDSLDRAGIWVRDSIVTGTDVAVPCAVGVSSQSACTERRWRDTNLHQNSISITIRADMRLYTYQSHYLKASGIYFLSQFIPIPIPTPFQ